MNPVTAFELLQRVAGKSGNTTAQGMLATMYSQGIGTGVSQEKAMLYHSFAVMGFEPTSAMALGYRHFYGIGTPASCGEAARYYQIASATAVEKFSRIDSRSLVKLRLTEEDRTASAESNMDLLNYFRAVADTGDMATRFSLGQFLLHGAYEVPQNVDEAFYHLNLAADGGHFPAFGLVGMMYVEGVGVERNPERGLVLIKEGVLRGDHNSLNAMGLLTLKGNLVPKDLAVARALFEKAAEKLNADAQVNLGIMFYSTVPFFS